MKQHHIILMIAALISILYIMQIDNFPAVGGDQPSYILLGQSLANGTGYTDIWRPVPRPHTKYPFVFPAMIASAIKIFGNNLWGTRILLLVLMTASLYLIYLFLIKIGVGIKTIASILVLTGISAFSLYYTYHILSEIPYMFFSVLALYLVQNYERKRMVFICALLFIMISYFTRSIGVSLAGAAIAYLFWDKRKKVSVRDTIIAGAILIIPIILWLIYGYLAKKTGGFEYYSAFMSMQDPLNPTVKLSIWTMLAHNVYAYAFYAVPNIITGIHIPSRNYLAFIGTIITLLGFINKLIFKRTIVEYYIVLYVLILFLWPWSAVAGARFLVPVLPFVFYYFITGSKILIYKLAISKKLKRIFLFLLLAIIFSLNLKTTFSYFASANFIRGEGKTEVLDFLQTAQWAKANTPPKSIFGGSNPPRIYYHFKRRALKLHLRLPIAALIESVKDNNIDYIFLNNSNDTILVDNNLTVVYKNGKNIILKNKR